MEKIVRKAKEWCRENKVVYIDIDGDDIVYMQGCEMKREGLDDVWTWEQFGESERGGQERR